jgi:large repetitive protein
VGRAYSQSLAATGGVAPYTWSIVAGSLPVGLSLNASTGLISGTPTVSGTNNFTVQVKGADQDTVTLPLSIKIYAPVAISTSTLPSGTVGVSYSQALAASDGVTPYTWSIASGSLPAGLTLNAATGVISGTPTAGGSSSVTVQVSDSIGTVASAGYSISVTSPGSGSVSFVRGDGKTYVQSPNGWYTDWTPPSTGNATIICYGAGGGTGYDTDSDDGSSGGTGGFSAIARTSTPATYISQAAGGTGGSGNIGAYHTGAAGNGLTMTGYPLSQISYRIYVGSAGSRGDYNYNITNYTIGTGGVPGQGSGSDTNGYVTIKW